MSAASSRARQLRLLNSGLCISCGKSEIVRIQRCSVCALKQVGHLERRRKRLRAAGLCRSCGKPQSAASKDFCSEHVKARNIKERQRRAIRKGSGTCVSCGKPSRPMRVSCERCAATMGRCGKERRVRLKSSRRCIGCGLELKRSETQFQCRQCLTKTNARTKARMDFLVSHGYCQACAKPRERDGTKRECRPCADKHTARELLRQKRRRLGIRPGPKATQGPFIPDINPNLLRNESGRITK